VLEIGFWGRMSSNHGARVRIAQRIVLFYVMGIKEPGRHI